MKTNFYNEISYKLYASILTMNIILEVAGGILVVIVLLAALFYVRPETINIMSEEPEVTECTTDPECMPAGCSNQVCAQIDKAPSLITTCEYREEYACLKETSCGCKLGKCAWKDIPEYSRCLADLK